MKTVHFKLTNQNNETLTGQVNIDTIDDDEPEFSYEEKGFLTTTMPETWQNEPVDWDMFQQYLWDFQDEDTILPFQNYVLVINDGERANKTTTIKISQLTKDKLDQAKVHHRETYEEVILRLLSQG